MAKSGDIQWSGRAARAVFWRVPKGAAKYTLDSNMALATDIGRRWLVFLYYGGFLWGLRWLFAKLILPGQWVIAVLLLLWFWHGLNLVQWSLHTRHADARARKAQREMYQGIQEIRGEVRQGFANMAGAARQVTGGVDVLNLFRSQPHPVDQEVQRSRRRQADQIRGQLPEESRGIPLGDRNEPLIPMPSMPKWLRRRGPR